MKRLIAIMIGVMVLLPLPFSSFNVASALEVGPHFGPQGLDDDFLYFGNSDYPKTVSQGITLTIDESSISFDSMIGEIRFDVDMIEERQITDIYVLANDRIVDYFDPSWDMDTKKWRRVYAGHRFALSNIDIGAYVKLQIVAVHQGEPNPINPEDFNNKYVVAWSNITPSYRMKDMPVVDNYAIYVLKQILEKLEELKSSMETEMQKLQQDVKNIYEIKPETQQKFDNALAGLQAALPTEQMKDQAQNMANVVQNSADRINNAEQKVKFGEIPWMGVITTSALDFTEFMDQITAIRRIVQITLWCEFFYFIILILRPRLTV